MLDLMSEPAVKERAAAGSAAGFAAPDPVQSGNFPARVAGTDHVPVMAAEALAGLAPVAGGQYVDGTFGGGGHTRLLLDATAPDGTVLAIDADPDAVARGLRLAVAFPRPDGGDASRLAVTHGNARDMAALVPSESVGIIDGVLLDLGLSSFQLDTAERGFAFRFDGPLDMRFDPGAGRSAADLVNTLPETDLADLIFRYGEEHRSRRIAAAVVARRRERPFSSTSDLAQVVSRAVGGRRGRDIHPATKTFQALRIATNDELEALREALSGAVAVLRPGGRLVVISFHSLEDRIVKRFIADGAAPCICPPRQPICTCGRVPTLSKVGGAWKASPAERERNPRSRSAVLRVAEKRAVSDRDKDGSV